ncbi:MAG: hypothetical protein N2508_12845 [Anaerolineae bacterium]|nr:hypothetical protein [Anaerolineae bacterium]
MSHQPTVGELFDLAIKIERTAQSLYSELARGFAHYQEIASFWEEYALEEADHALWLEKVRDALPPDQLDEPADLRVVEEARKILMVSVDDLLARIRDLEDAYELVHEFESPETNTIFEFLITHFYGREDALSFIRTQLRGHIARITTEFPSRFSSPAARREVKLLRG